MTDPAPPRHQAPYTPMPRGLLILAGSIALIELALSAADRGILADPSLRMRVYAAGAFWGDLLRGADPAFAAQPWTMFLTHALLHGSMLHMLMNMAILLALGRFAADNYGAGMVVPLFAAGAVAGAVAFALFGDARHPMVGASGAVFAFLGLWVFWDWRRHRSHGASVAPVRRRVLVLVGLNVVMYFALGGLLAWEAHLGGFLAGIVAGSILENRRSAAARAERAEARRRREAE